MTLAHSGRFYLGDECEQFGIRRKTGYKHLARYAACGMAGLEPRNSRPQRSADRTSEQIEAWIRAERRAHRTWGPKKLRRMLEVKHQVESPPECSTIAAILSRHGLSVRRMR